MFQLSIISPLDLFFFNMVYKIVFHIKYIRRDDSFVTHYNRIYKMPDGKPENVFGFDGAYKDPEFAAKVFIQTLFK